MNSIDSGKDRIIFALDTGERLEEALRLVDLLKDHVGLFKVGKEAFTHFGPLILSEIAARGGKVFLDLKFHDIPNTVARAGEAAVRWGVSMFNVHAAGGREMMGQTVAAVRKASEERGKTPPLVLAVTVLTSLSSEDLREVGFGESADRLALRLAVLAREAGADGVVCSAREARAIRLACGPGFVLVTAGIRWDALSGDDQKRVETPAGAIEAGADYLVVGRPIRSAKDPVDAARRIGEEIDRALGGRTIPGR
jgi:orotidine-5'-phosphate decarboxylase